MSSWYRIVNKSTECAEVMIYDEIGVWGITAKKFVEDLNAITAKDITLCINSPGGQVFEGFAIYSAIKAHRSRVSVRVDGVAASIASVIALAGETCSLAKNAYMMIHNPLSQTFGNAEELRKEAELLDKLRNTIAGVYAEKSGKPIDEITKCMDAETWFDAAECKAFGLCDSIDGEDGDDDEDEAVAASALVAMKAALACSKLPDRLKRIAAVLAKSPVQPTVQEPQQTTEIPMLLNIVSRDGKQFVTIDGKEHEVAAPQSAAPTAPKVIDAAQHAQELEAARTAAVATERAYAKDFNTCLVAAGITGKVAEAFTGDFYGLDMKQVKFLASNHIGARAKPVGEGGAADPTTAPESPEAVAKAAEDAEGKRFDSDENLRRAYGLRNSQPESAEYKAVRARHVSGAVRDAKATNNKPLITAKKS